MKKTFYPLIICCLFFTATFFTTNAQTLPPAGKAKCPATITYQEVDYKVTSLGGMCWTENMKNRLYDDGEEIPFARPYQDKEENIGIFGLLYDWNSATGATRVNPPLPTPNQGICPDGWRLPTQEDFLRLTKYSDAQLKSANFWIGTSGTDNYDFTALPAGLYNPTLFRFVDIYGITGYWTCTPASATQAHSFWLNYYCAYLQNVETLVQEGLSVRCVLDCYEIEKVTITPNTSVTKELDCDGNPKSGHETTTFTAHAENATSYEWYVDNVKQAETSETFVYATPAGNAGTYTVYAAAVNKCTHSNTVKTTEVMVNVTKDVKPAQPGTISGTPSVCAGGSAENYIISTVTGATSYSWNFPAGWTTDGSTGINISATPTATAVSGNITVTANNICGSSTPRSFAVTVNPNNTVSAASATPTLCINTALTNITHTTTGATGISQSGVAGANGLPAGVSASWSSNQITISGTPTASGTFNYSIPLTGGCGTVSAAGTITVTPCCDPAVGVLINGVCWAKTNLNVGGVFAANPYDYGALYQWGRKSDGHENRFSAKYPTDNYVEESGIVSGADLDATGQVAPTSGAYGKFIKNDAHPDDWRFPQTDTLWNRGTAAVPVKTINDPCPAGWRVPTEIELSSLTAGTVTGVWTTNYLSSGINGRLFTDNTGGVSNGNFIFLPAAGFRNHGTGEVLYSGEDGVYWSSTVYGIGARYLLFLDGPVGVSSFYRAIGFSVRCVSE